MSTLRKVVRDIYGRLDIDSVDKSDIYFNDVVSEINTSITNKVYQYTQAGRGQVFSVTEDIYFSIKDLSYPFLYYTDLEFSPISLEPHTVILGANVYKVTDSVKNNASSYTKDTILRKGDSLYKVTHDVTNTNIYDTTFNSRDVRPFMQGNELKYVSGDIVEDYQTGYYWKVNTDFTESDTDISTVADRVYLRLYRSDAYATPTFHPFKHINDLKLYNDVDGGYGFTYNGAKLYVTKNIKRMSISYVPEWEEVTDPDQELVVPHTVLSEVKNDVVQVLLPKVKDMQRDVGVQNG